MRLATYYVQHSLVQLFLQVAVGLFMGQFGFSSSIPSSTLDFLTGNFFRRQAAELLHSQMGPEAQEATLQDRSLG